ncbi:hypothetical protein SZN_17407 [Streptomyces zinciresistens K42]|uniref:Uncharacterized protein n=1 Tax=Streptomyces zinciresistens K42 TaxID=700597 RepID=G2GDA4_9ACTN|nr:hypothetical protein SZN_17407 [Streptomyces zinciresistens K42]
MAAVRTNGRPGTPTYRWTRSDGTASGVLREVLVRGRQETRLRLRLRWTFRGEGRRTARAELRLLTPDRFTAAARFAYDCR